MKKHQKILSIVSFQENRRLDKSDGYIKANIAVWINLDKPALAAEGRLYLQYFAGLGFKTIELDQLAIPSQSNALLSACANIPAELQNVSFDLCVEVTGSDFATDTVFIQPVERPVRAKRRRTLAA